MSHVEKNGLLLKNFRRRRVWPEVVSAAVEQNPLALEFCDAWFNQWCITEPMVMTAVAKNGLALRFVPAKFKVRHAVLVAVGQNPRAAKYIGDKALLVDAVREYPHALKFARSEFLADADVVSVAFAKDKTSLRFATKPAVLELISRFPHEDLLQLAKGSLQEDVDILSTVQPFRKAKKDLADWGSAEATVAVSRAHGVSSFKAFFVEREDGLLELNVGIEVTYDSLVRFNYITFTDSLSCGLCSASPFRKCCRGTLA